MNKPHLVPLAFAGLVGATGLAGAAILAVTLDGNAGAVPATDLVPALRPDYAGKPTPAPLVGA
jgi:hypothetical protein